ncbi:hypothetical protein C6B38_05020, partial [Spiroplasma sp. ChiS]|uniref:hypothetical protein n=1 Tax=Spiroplasma sp. ChiS TaxID=2099885 RepID=UPI000D4C3C54
MLLKFDKEDGKYIVKKAQSGSSITVNAPLHQKDDSSLELLLSDEFDNNNSKLLSSFWCNGALTVIELPLCAFLTIYFPSSLISFSSKSISDISIPISNANLRYNFASTISFGHLFQGEYSLLPL